MVPPVSGKTFSLNEKEKEKADQWLKEHVKKCKKVHPSAEMLSASDGLVSYIFTPTSIGTGISIRCACKEKFNVTDYASW